MGNLLKRQKKNVSVAQQQMTIQTMRITHTWDVLTRSL